jgi:hypothetical protein
MIGANPQSGKNRESRVRWFLLFPLLLGVAGCAGTVVVGLAEWVPSRGDSDGYIVGLGFIVLLCSAGPAVLQLLAYVDGAVAFSRGRAQPLTWLRIAAELGASGVLVLLLAKPVVDAAGNGWWVLVMPVVSVYVLGIGLWSLFRQVRNGGPVVGDVADRLGQPGG